MYLRGLSGAYDSLPPNVRADAIRCEDAGGYPIVKYQAYDANRAGIPSSAFIVCDRPAGGSNRAAPAPKISVKVPTTVNTQINPTINPTLVQQDQPTGSPVTTSHVTPPSTQSSGDTLAAELLELLGRNNSSPAQVTEYIPGTTTPTPSGTAGAGQSNQTLALIGLAAIAGLLILKRR